MLFIPLHYCTQFISFLKFILPSNSSLPSIFQLFFTVFFLYFEVTKGFLLDSETQISMKPANRRFSLNFSFQFPPLSIFHSACQSESQTLYTTVHVKNDQKQSYLNIFIIFYLIKTYCKTSTYITNLVYLLLFSYFLV